MVESKYQTVASMTISSMENGVASFAKVTVEADGKVLLDYGKRERHKDGKHDVVKQVKDRELTEDEIAEIRKSLSEDFEFYFDDVNVVTRVNDAWAMHAMLDRVYE